MKPTAGQFRMTRTATEFLGASATGHLNEIAIAVPAHFASLREVFALTAAEFLDASVWGRLDETVAAYVATLREAEAEFSDAIVIVSSGGAEVVFHLALSGVGLALSPAEFHMVPSAVEFHEQLPVRQTERANAPDLARLPPIDFAPLNEICCSSAHDVRDPHSPYLPRSGLSVWPTGRVGTA